MLSSQPRISSLLRFTRRKPAALAGRRWPEWYIYFYKATIQWWHWRSVILSNAFNPPKHCGFATVGDVLPNYEAQRSGAKVQRVVFRSRRALFFQQVCVRSSMLQLHRNGHDAQKVSYGRWASISGATNESRGTKLPVAGNPSGIRDRDSNPSTAAASGLFRGTKTWHSREKGPRSQTTVHLLAGDPCLTHGGPSGRMPNGRRFLVPRRFLGGR